MRNGSFWPISMHHKYMACVLPHEPHWALLTTTCGSVFPTETVDTLVQPGKPHNKSLGDGSWRAFVVFAINASHNTDVNRALLPPHITHFFYGRLLQSYSLSMVVMLLIFFQGKS